VPPAAALTPAIIPSPTGKPVELAKPVESGELGNIDPDALGLLGAEQGGLGAAMWKGVPRELVERLMPALSLPSISPALNNLANRFLLTTANVPEGTGLGGKQSLTAMRVERLIALGDAADAWKLTALAKPGQIDEITMRLVAEAALVSDADKDVCAKLPAIIQAHNAPEWQESLVVCQLRANDTKGAQVALDVLHAQNVHDDLFFALAEHNLIGGSKSLPRQLTPLKPLELALLRLIDQPLSGEVYAHPDAALIPELLRAKPRDEASRLALAERAASRGSITAAELEAAYTAVIFTPDRLAAPTNTSETGARLHALLYQAATAEKIPAQRLADAVKFLQTSDPAFLTGTGGQVLAAMVDPIVLTDDDGTSSASLAEIYTLAGLPEPALKWLTHARATVAAAAISAAAINGFWPLMVLTGLESDSDYGQTFSVWLGAVLKDADHAKREQIGNVLLLLDAAGFSVPEEAWAHVTDVSANDHRLLLPPPLLLERLRAAGATNQRGAAVLLGLIATGSAEDPPLLPVIETIRALRLVGLKAAATALARETAAALLLPSASGAKP
jgi:hypothetical protein